MIFKIEPITLQVRLLYAPKRRGRSAVEGPIVLEARTNSEIVVRPCEENPENLINVDLDMTIDLSTFIAVAQDWWDNSFSFTQFTGIKVFRFALDASVCVRVSVVCRPG